jgi:2-deoxy-D-gluconate 3-dehydrogenase
VPFLDRFDLTGRTALVTGARTGIGRAIAIGLAESGAELILHGHHADLAEVAAAVRAAGKEPVQVVADLAEPGAASALCDRVMAEHRVDILVNNAGTIRRAPAIEYTEDDWRDVLTTNLESTWVLSQRLGGAMVGRGMGKIVNVASVLSFQGGIRVVAYAASKHAVAGITRALANEWAGRNVQVNAIAPGYIATAGTEALRDDPEREQAIRSRIPAGRWGVPEDVVGAAVFLASPASDYVNGHLLAVDGGWLAR